MTALDLADTSVAGVVAYYSTIHIPDGQLPGVFAEFRRVLAPGGHLLLAFQVGDEPMRLTEAFGQAISLDFHRRRPERVAGLLTAADLPVRARFLREPVDDGSERTPQAFLIARRPAPGQPA
ncbi:methyltransferase [Parafrankia sp. EAN1pec]|nr:methyltransferase [Frankia sp. EAN1pec]